MHFLLYAAGWAGVILGAFVLQTITKSTGEAEKILAIGFGVAIIGFSALTIGLGAVVSQLRAIRDRMTPR